MTFEKKAKIIRHQNDVCHFYNKSIYVFAIYNWFEYSTIMLQSNIILKAGSPMDVFTQMANVTGSIQFLVIQIS